MRRISMSGGKDSTACLLLALERHPKDEGKAVFADPAALEAPSGCSSSYGLCDLGQTVEDDEEELAVLELFA